MNSSSNYKLEYLINVFNVSPDFLLPVFKANDRFFAQRTKNNQIVSFTEIEIKKYTQNTKVFTLPSDFYYSEGSEALYAIENENQYFFGSCKEIVFFFKSNKSSFKDEDFIKSMMEFIKKNALYFPSNSKSIPSESKKTSELQQVLDSPYPQPISEAFRFSNPFYMPKRSKVEVLSDNIEKHLAAIDKHFYYDALSLLIKESNQQLTEFEEKLFDAISMSPSILNLWTNKLINAYTNASLFYEKIGLNIGFAKDMFRKSRNWRENDLPKEINESQAEGFEVFFLSRQTVSNGIHHFDALISQLYDTNKFFIKFNYRLHYSSFIEYVNSLILDINNNQVCFIIEEVFLEIFGDLSQATTFFDSNNNIKFILPPNNDSVPTYKNHSFY